MGEPTRFSQSFEMDPQAAETARKSKGNTDVPETNKLDLREAIGRRYKAEDLRVEEAWIKDYALATNDPNPRYLEGDLVAPPIFPVRLFRDVMFAAIGDPEVGLDMLRLVHGEQDMTWHGPIRPGDLVTLEAVIETVAQKAKGCVLAIRKFGIVDGETRVEARMSVFVRGQMLPGIEVGEVLGEVPATGGAPEGEPVATSTRAVAMDQPKRYAAASLDVNPIHLDEAVAKKAGLPSVILHGLCSMAFACTGVVDELLGGDSSRLHRFAVRFSRPVLPGWVLTTKIWDAGITEDGRKAYQVETYNADGVKVIANGWAEIDAE